MKLLTALLLSGFIANVAHSATIAVIDSGVDILHEDLEEQIWINEYDRGGNGADEDQNGYVDDTYGWNFAENNHMVIDRKYIGTFSDDPKRFFEIQTRMLMGKSTDKDREWLESKRGDQEFMQELSKFANFVHGTHVGGITAHGNEGTEILAVKIIPTEVKMPGQFVEQANMAPTNDDFKIEMVKMGLRYIAQQQGQQFTNFGMYVNGHSAHVANGSFGTGINQAKMIIAQIFPMIVGREPTPEEEYDIAKDFLTTAVQEGKKMVTASPHTLFVFAAGNDANDNDDVPTSPSNVDAGNSISVAATMGHSQIAVFSSFGRKTVHVAAPGVGIDSQIPDNDNMRMSGTSQAAPFVSNVAGAIYDINSKLKPFQIKEILIKTVDKKDWLKDRVISGGMVNAERAARAATLSKEMSLRKAIKQARAEVADVAAEKVEVEQSLLSLDMVLPLPSMYKVTK